MSQTIPMVGRSDRYNYLPEANRTFWFNAMFPGFNPTNELIVIRASRVVNGTIVSNWSHGRDGRTSDFYWPKVGRVFLPRGFDPSNICGHGLHGCNLADPESFNSITNPEDAVIQLVRVKREDAFLVTAQGIKVKFRAGDVVLTTNKRQDIMDVIAAGLSSEGSYAARRVLPNLRLVRTL